MSKLRLGSRLIMSRATLSINSPVPDLGGMFVSDTVERTCDQPQAFAQILCLTDTVIDIAGSNIANVGANNANTATAVTLKAGTMLPLIANRFKLASGTVVAYYCSDRGFIYETLPRIPPHRGGARCRAQHTRK